MEKLTVAIIFGGKSAEHEVSLQSALSIINAIDREKYTLLLIGVNRDGRFYLYEDKESTFDNLEDPENIKLKKSTHEIAFIPGEGNHALYNLKKNEYIESIDVVFPIIHGSMGEDGTLQGLLELINVPYVGGNVLSSALCMDKAFTKQILERNNISTSKYLIYTKTDGIDYRVVKDELGLPIFIKPANLGSSIGITKAVDENSFREGIELAFKYDQKILLEEFIDGREIECSLLGFEDKHVSIPGEIEPTDGFYSYESKYINENGATLSIPAQLDVKEVERIKSLALKTYEILEVNSFCRIDFFLTPDQIYVNEINTIPGFTKISMYPKLFSYQGVKYSELISQLIDIAIARYDKKSELLDHI